MDSNRESLAELCLVMAYVKQTLLRKGQSAMDSRGERLSSAYVAYSDTVVPGTVGQ